MTLRTKLTLYFSILFCALLSLFSSLVYVQVKKNVLVTAESALLSHLEHDASHLGHHHRDGVHGGRSVPRDGVYLRIWENGRLIEDSMPKSVGVLRVDEPDAKRIVRRMTLTRDDKFYELVGYHDLSRTNDYLRTLRNILVFGCAAATLLIFPVGMFLTRMLLTPFRQLADETSRLDAQHLTFRFPDPHRRDEFGVLISNFNLLLDRLEASFDRVRRFAAQASHELRTPLAVIISQTEMALRRPRTAEEHQEVATKVLSQAKHLRDITNRFLTFADIERAEAEASRSEVQVSDTLQDVLGTLSVAYRATPKNIVVKGPVNTIRYRGSGEILHSIVSNLIENAYKYAKHTIAIEVERDQSALRLTVEDDGPGIPAAMRERVFEPFTRGQDNAEAPVASHGLGLAIVEACIKACAGTVALKDSVLGGLRVEIRLPEVS